MAERPSNPESPSAQTDKFVISNVRHDMERSTYRRDKLARLAQHNPELARQIIGIATQGAADVAKNGKPVKEALEEALLSMHDIDEAQLSVNALTELFPEAHAIEATVLAEQPDIPPAA